jgi:hypothetical protein
MASEDIDQIMADPEDTNERNAKEMREEIEGGITRVVIDDAHPFDLEGYIAQYSGMVSSFDALCISSIKQLIHQVELPSVTFSMSSPIVPS